MKEGILIIDKPEGLTSHDVVDFIRKKLSLRKVGHAGTLDPLATGLLVILIGKYTRKFREFMSFDKEYLATLTLGIRTDTGDAKGTIIGKLPYDDISEEKLRYVFKEFQGEIEQIPPMFSALKYKGKRLYQLARKGINVPRSARKIKIYNLELVSFNPPNVELRILCSKGTYIRSLAEDIGRRLGCGAFISRIKRIGLGPFKIKDAISLENIDESFLRSWPDQKNI